MVQTQPYYQTPEQSQQIMESDPAGPVPLGPGSAAQMPPQMTPPGMNTFGLGMPNTMVPPQMPQGAVPRMVNTPRRPGW